MKSQCLDENNQALVNWGHVNSISNMNFSVSPHINVTRRNPPKKHFQAVFICIDLQSSCNYS